HRAALFGPPAVQVKNLELPWCLATLARAGSDRSQTAGSGAEPWETLDENKTEQPAAVQPASLYLPECVATHASRLQEIATITGSSIEQTGQQAFNRAAGLLHPALSSNDPSGYGRTHKGCLRLAQFWHLCPARHGKTKCRQLGAALKRPRQNRSAASLVFGALEQ